MRCTNEQRIISQSERENNIAVIDACRTGLHFVCAIYRTKNGGGGFSSLVYNGRRVSINSDTVGDSLDQLNEKGYVLKLRDDDEIPAAFLPSDLEQVIRFNQWKQ